MMYEAWMDTPGGQKILRDMDLGDRRARDGSRWWRFLFG